MKVKLLALLCIASLLLIGCSGEPTENTEESTTVTGESNAPTVVTTEPTKPQTIFEEQGLTLWENCAPETGVNTNYGTACGEYEGFGAYVYIEEYESRDFISGEAADSDLNVTITEYFSKSFPMIAKLDDVLDQFYEDYTAEEGIVLSKDEWMAEQNDKKIVSIDIYQYIHSAEYVRAMHEKNDLGHINYGVRNAYVMFVDAFSGNVLDATSSYQDEMLKMEIEHNGEIYNIKGILETSSEPRKNHSEKDWCDFTVIQSMYVLVPEDYDAYAFAYLECLSAPTKEEHAKSINEANGQWEQSTVEELENGGKYKYYYFTMMEK